MKVYGTPICMHCRNFMAINKSRHLNLEYINITENTKNLKEYLVVRDTHEAFKDIRGKERIGIPLFVEGDKITMDMDEAFSWIGQEKVKEEEIIEKED
ncbi:MAG: hypothetical protein HUJ53_03680 [Holdemanella sp.]|nr:hypothetical protein [Holdemanella sp.]